MLITLKSNSDADAVQFQNHFQEGIIIQPHSEIALVSSSYDIGHTVAIKTGVNDTFEVQADPTGFGLAITVTLNAGTYTLPSLCTEILRATNASAAYSAAFTATVFPSSGRLVTEDHADAAKIKFEFTYDPQGGVPSSGSSSEGSNGFRSYISGEVAGGINLAQGNTKRGLYYKDGTTDTYASGKVCSYESNNVKGQAFGYSNVDATDGMEYFCLSFKPGDGEMLIGITDNGDLAADACPIQFRIGADDSFQAYQKIADGSIVRYDQPQNQVVDRTKFQRIIVPATGQSNGGLSTDVIYQSAASHGSTISSGTSYTTDPQIYDPTGRPHYVVASIKTPNATGLVPLLNNASGVTGVVSKANSVLTPGDNYLVGEIVVGSGGTGTGFKARVNTIGGGGQITDYTVTNAGTGYTAADVITLSGQGSLRTNASLAATTVTTAATIETAGTLWQVGDAPNDIEGKGVIITIDAVDGGGAITGLSVTTAGANYAGGNLSFTNPNAGGDDCVIKFPYFSATYATMNQLKHNQLITGASMLPQLDRNNRNRITLGQGLADTLNMTAAPKDNTGDDLTFESATDITSASRVNNQMIVNIDNFPLKSIHKGGNGQAVAVVPIGGSTNKDTGLFFQESFNLLYHKLENREVINANEATVRITDTEGAPIEGLLHPVTINLDLRPAAR